MEIEIIHILVLLYIGGFISFLTNDNKDLTFWTKCVVASIWPIVILAVIVTIVFTLPSIIKTIKEKNKQ